MWRWERIFFHFNGEEDVYYTLCSSMGGGNKAGQGGGGRKGGYNSGGRGGGGRSTVIFESNLRQTTGSQWVD